MTRVRRDGVVDSTARVERPGEIRAALIAVGAVSPGTARARAEFPLLDDGAFDALVRQGVIREAAPGTFYVFQAEAQSHDWPRVLKGLLFWLVMLLIPVLLIQFIG